MEKLWLKSYEQGVNPEIDISQYSSISDVFRQSVEKFADKPVFQNMGKTLTYAEVGKLATDFASYLQNVLKLPRGERVAIMMPNVLQYPIALFGILQAGLVAVNTNPLYTPRELEHQLKDSGATTIVVLENFANTLELVLPRTQIKHVIVASVGEMFGMIKGALLNFAIRKVKKMVPEYRIPNTITFQTAFNWFSTLPLQLRKRIRHCRIGWGAVVALGFAVAAFLMSGFRRPVAFGCATQFVIQPHSQRNAFTRSIDFQHFYFHHIAGFHHFTRVLDELVGQGGDVHQAVLMDADVHERAEVGNVGNHAFEYHADLQVADFMDTFSE